MKGILGIQDTVYKSKFRDNVLKDDGPTSKF